VITKEELEKVLADHKLWLRMEGGRRADLRGTDLSGTNLDGADLAQANLIGANLSFASLVRADLSRADLSGATLTRCVLRMAYLSYALLPEVRAPGACFSQANLEGATMNGANLRGARFDGACLRRAYMREADLTNAGLTHTDLGSVDLSQTVGLLDPSRWIMHNLETVKEGIIVYKSFDEYYPAPNSWSIYPGAVISEIVNFDRTLDCACGINVSTWEWSQQHCDNEVWRCLIRWEWLPGVVVPYCTDGQFRTSKLEILQLLTEEAQ